MLEFVIDKLIGLLGPISTLSREKRELKDNALRAISTALTETYIYYSSLERGAERSLDTEAQLARYWSAAAIPLRHIDMALAEVCENKAEYWISPERYSDEQIKAMGIKLGDVKRAYRQLAMPSLSKASRALRT